MKVTDNNFTCGFLHLDEEESCFEIAAELSFDEGEFVFREMSSRAHNIIEVKSHFLTASALGNGIIPREERYDRIGVEVFPDQAMNCFRAVTFVHNVAIRLVGFVTLTGKFHGMSGIMDPAV